MANFKLGTVSTVDAVCRSLEEDIYSLRYRPGEKICESELTERYEVSRNTVREAIAFLVSSGLLVKFANRGVYVRKITVDDIREIFHLRELLEAEAIRTIVYSGHVPQELQRAAALATLISPTDDWQGNIRADLSFHRLLIECSGYSRLVRLYDSILSEVKLCVYQSYDFISSNLLPVRTENEAHHRNMLRAMEQGNLDAALAFLSVHISSAIDNYCDGYRMREAALNSEPACRA